MDVHSPLLTIITVVKNDARNLAETLSSIDIWDRRIEVLVKDGLSRDDTAQVAGKFSQQGLRLIVQADLGIYDAMNQGVHASLGTYVMFVNAGDTLVPGALERIVNRLSERHLLYKFLVQTDNNSPRRERGSVMFFARYMLNHQGLVYHRRCFENQFDTNLKIVGDLRHLLEYGLWRRVTYADELVVRYKGGGIASTFRSIRKNWSERLTVLSWKRVGLTTKITVFLVAFLGLLYWELRNLVRSFSVYGDSK
jgi:glycosyltransferase involved in cell wall biosynthesis